MNASRACLECRRRLCQIRSDRLLQWQAKRTFISLSDITDESPNHGASHSKNKIDLPPTLRKTPHGRPKNRTYRGFSDEAGDVLESLFEESIKQPVAPVQNPSKQLGLLEPYKNAETLNRMLGEGQQRIPDAWSFFVEHFGPEAWGKGLINSTSVPSYLKHSTIRLLDGVTKMKREDPFSTTLPSVADICRVYLGLGVLRGSHWVVLVSHLLNGLSKAEKLDLQDDSSDIDERLIVELLGAWHLMSRRVGISVGELPPGPNFDWSYLPVLNQSDVSKTYKNLGAQHAFSLLFPQVAVSDLKDLPIVALATFGHLTSKSRTDTGIAAGADPLISALAKVIMTIDYDSTLTKAPSVVSQDVTSFVRREYPAMKDLAFEMMKTSPETTQRQYNHASTGLNPKRKENSIKFFKNRVFDAIEQNNLLGLEKLWGEVEQWPLHKKGPVIPGVLTAYIANWFVFGFVKLKQGGRAIDVWNHMIKIGLLPDLKTWECMLDGCKQSHSWKALEDVWLKMRDLNVRPSHLCWLIRIRGLLSLSKYEMAMEALDEMGRIWLAAARKRYPDMPLDKLHKKENIKGAEKPSATIVNAAIDGLFKLKEPQFELASRVLEWGVKFGFEPDVVTYNVLLRPLARHGHMKEAVALLQTMQKQRVQADTGTFSTLLDETLRHADRASPEEQMEIVESVFTEMEAVGIEADLFVYGKVIYALLQNPQLDYRVANGVLERLYKNGLKPTAHINTILLQYYFTRDPPDLDSVKGLLARVRLEPGSADRKFWDLLIEWYSRIGDTTSALTCLSKEKNLDDRIGWASLHELLLALVRNEEWDNAKDLVRNMMKTRRLQEFKTVEELEGFKQSFQFGFWKTVAELKLVDKQEGKNAET